MPGTSMLQSPVERMELRPAVSTARGNRQRPSEELFTRATSWVAISHAPDAWQCARRDQSMISQLRTVSVVPK